MNLRVFYLTRRGISDGYGNAGMEHKKTGFTIIYRCKKIVLWKNINIFANYLRGVLEK